MGAPSDPSRRRPRRRASLTEVGASLSERNLMRSLNAIHQPEAAPRRSSAVDPGHRSDGSEDADHPRMTYPTSHRASRRGSMETVSPTSAAKSPVSPLEMHQARPAQAISRPPFADGSGPPPRRAKKFRRRHSVANAGDVPPEFTQARRQATMRQTQAHDVSHQDKPPAPQPRATQDHGQGGQPRRRVTLSDAPAPQNLARPGQAGFRPDYSLGDPVKHRSHMMVPPNHAAATNAVASLQVHDFAFVRRSNGGYSYAILADISVEPAKDDPSKGEEACMFVMTEAGATKSIRRRHWAEMVRLVRPESQEFGRSAPELLPPPMISPQADKPGFHDAVPVTSESRCPPTLEAHLRDLRLLCREVAPNQPRATLQDPRAAYCQEIHHRAAARQEPNQEQEPKPELTDEMMDSVPSMVTFVPPKADEEEVCSLISSVSDRARLACRGQS